MTNANGFTGTTHQTAVTQQDIDYLLDNSVAESHIFWGKEICVSYLLPNGFTVTGRCACINPRNFNVDIGVGLCRQDAARQLWALEGYRLTCDLYREGYEF